MSGWFWGAGVLHGERRRPPSLCSQVWGGEATPGAFLKNPAFSPPSCHLLRVQGTQGPVVTFGSTVQELQY